MSSKYYVGGCEHEWVRYYSPMASVIAVIALIAGAVGGTFLTGSIFAGGSTIEACANGQHLRIVDNAGECKKNEDSVSWNEQGM